MMLRQSGKRKGLSRADALLAVLISFTALCLLSCGLGSARTGAKRIECINNLRQIGIAMHNYHDTNNVFPTENGTNNSFYRGLLTFIEQSPVDQQVQQNAPIKLYLCPLRRTPATAPGKRDYGYAASGGTGSVGKSVLDTPGGYSFANTKNPVPTNLTLLLTHVWMDPANYGGGDPTDLGWATQNNSRSVNNTAKADSDSSGSTSHLGSPHPGKMPALFLDAHVQDIPYSFGQWAELWAHDSKKDAIQLP
jgi:prepilin-type processing-associated H-X9-DG protein